MTRPIVPGQKIVTSVHLTTQKQPKTIPVLGFYVQLNYMFGDADGYTSKTTGPFPIDRNDLLIEFLNVLEAMLATYPNGKGGFDDYSGVPGYNEWFDEDTDISHLPDARLREQLQSECVITPDGFGGVATLTDYEVYYHDGKTLTRYNVAVVSH